MVRGTSWWLEGRRLTTAGDWLRAVASDGGGGGGDTQIGGGMGN